MDDSGIGAHTHRMYNDAPGPSRLVREVVSNIEDYQTPQSTSDNQNKYKEEPQVDRPIDNIEQHGRFIEDQNGDYYMVLDDTNNGEIVAQDDMGVEYMIDIDGGNEAVIIDDREEYAEGDDSRNVVYQKNYNEVAVDKRWMPANSNVSRMYNKGGITNDTIFLETVPQGLKSRKNRQYGSCRCPECGTSFVNTARLERHLAVHQVFGSYLCPLCGKTYKYEYNLFYHWRKTCRDLNELILPEERHTMDVNALRHLVDEVALKKTEIGPIDMGISKSVLFQAGPLARLEMPQNPFGRRGTSCRACGVVVASNHMPRHLCLHRGEGVPDARSNAGGFFCDLCGLVFRQHFNLIKHWRTGCAEIQANLPNDVELTLDNDQLCGMVKDLLKRAVTIEMDNLPEVKRDMYVDQGLIPTDDMDGRGENEQNNEAAYDRAEPEPMPNHWESTDPCIVFADDFCEEEDEAQCSTSNNMNTGTNRDKWRVGHPGGGVQCPECFRTFANAGRLERHLAGFHASFGSHHCVLCGNRFKYDYNLLYHYRRSCPYTKAFIDQDIREQMDAQTLRKLVRQLAQKEVRLSPQVKPETYRLMNMKRLNSEVIKKKEPFKYPGEAGAPPAQLLQARAGLADARACPMCSVVFYGKNSISRHMEAAHGIDADSIETQPLPVSDPSQQYNDRSEDYQIMNYLEDTEEQETDDSDPPPLLEREDPIEVERRENTSPQKPQGFMFLDENGANIRELSDYNNEALCNMIENNELNVGDRLSAREKDVEVTYTVRKLNIKSRTIEVIREHQEFVTEEIVYAEDISSQQNDEFEMPLFDNEEYNKRQKSTIN